MTRNRWMPLATLLLHIGFSVAHPTIGFSEEDLRVPAKAQFELGLEHYQNKNFLPALAAFEASYRLRSSAAVLFNIAMCQNALIRYIESYDSFRLLLTENRLSEDSEMKKLAETAMMDILRKVGVVTLAGLPNGAEVFVDGRVRAVSEKDPFLLVEPGARTIVVSKVGYLAKQIGVVASPGGHFSMDAALVPDPSAVKADAALPRSFDTASPDFPKTTPASPSIRFDPSSFPTVPPPRGKGLLVGGLVSTLTGVAGIGIGIAFGVVYQNSHDDALSPISKSNDAVDRQNKEDYDRYFSVASAEIKDFEDNELKNRAFMIAGFAIGGTAFAVGSVLLSAHARKRRETPRSSTIALSLDGVVVTF